VRDRANDAVRVDGRELRAKVVAEGGNLGFTQEGRVEAALAGVRLETDSVDNSAGVDLSDHEVNLKIALAPLVQTRALPRDQRDRLLFESADAACASVLEHNRAQALGLSLDELRARLDREGFLWSIEQLCRAEGLRPEQGSLPDAAELEARHGGLVRPELAWLLGVAKLHLQRSLLADPGWQLPAFAEHLYTAYFPKPIAEASPKVTASHRLRREIGAMVATNRLIDAGGVTLMPLLCRELEAPPPRVADALLLAHEILTGIDYRERVLAQPGVARSAVYDALFVLDAAVRGVARLLVRRAVGSPPRERIARWQAALTELRALRTELPSQSESLRGEERVARLTASGLSADLARDVAGAAVAPLGLSIVWVSEESGAPLPAAAIAFTALGERTGLNWAYERIARAWPSDPWDRVELELLRGELFDLHAALAADVLREPPSEPLAAVERFLAPRAPLLERIAELRRRALASDRPSALAAVTKALQRLRPAPGSSP
jgi:glutamate dehydrogenase